MSEYKKQLLATEEEQYGNYIPLLDIIYVIPTRTKHDSGYMCMEVIGETKGYKKKLATFSDVFELNSIIGGHNCLSLSMDLEETGIIRFFSHEYKFKVERYGCSEFEISLVKEDGN